MDGERRRKGEGNSRAILIAPVEDQEGIGLAEEILFVQFVSAELHHYRFLMSRDRKRQNKCMDYTLYMPISKQW